MHALRPPRAQLIQSKAAEIEGLLGRLSDANDAMGGVLGGTSDARGHTLARHRDILHDFTQASSAAHGSASFLHVHVCVRACMVARERLVFLWGGVGKVTTVTLVVDGAT